MSKIIKNIQNIYEKISNFSKKNKIKSRKIKLLIVTKNQGTHVIKKMIKNKFVSFGENYLQESLKKIKKFKKNKLKWHFLGKIQSNKTKLIAKNFSWCHTIDRKKIAFLLNKHRNNITPPLNVLIQINISNNRNKNGTSKESCFQLAEYVKNLKNLHLKGIMCLPNLNSKNDEYQKIQNIFQKMKKKYKNINTLSLGTSQDFKKAILYGSTLIRIGKKIFS
ncbi:YggS family pyridoxal phosphate-dependent enzyme [Buchnera aphidicola]|uniref:YggS family pyridoxal phosphate-dependent enzyme n=1 Tax=Buchnera aphidicola TaxID=9 RepID=UPI002093B3D9|nr:YggS family pyridoxal phosphate-dependent enzyme [Buchnera aphidicola]USS94103.1 YggS family pyridoxal phosphate-dependent enzyme [Buchnera aphidicola (Sipha maydis)]WII23650.1 YggS family pyridoxal phosphate-dependent enzyme [Buchnera aphidicola (Sipha maydis)]